MKKILTIKEAAEYAGITTPTLDKFLRNGELRYYKPTNKLRYVKLDDLINWLTSNLVNPKNQKKTKSLK